MKRIAIIEDVPAIRELYKYALEPIQAEIQAYPSVAEAVKHVEDYHPDLLILDHRLQDTTGYSILEQVPLLQQIPVIVISGYLDPEIIPHYHALGVKNILNKPVDIEVLVQQVNQLLYTQH